MWGKQFFARDIDVEHLIEAGDSVMQHQPQASFLIPALLTRISTRPNSFFREVRSLNQLHVSARHRSWKSLYTRFLPQSAEGHGFKSSQSTAEVVDNDIASTPREQYCSGSAYAARRAGNDDDLIF